LTSYGSLVRALEGTTNGRIAPRRQRIERGPERQTVENRKDDAERGLTARLGRHAPGTAGLMAATKVLEREAKFDVSRSFEPPAVDGFELVGERQVELEATYWDTGDLRLLWVGVTLRHRRASDGSESGWTVKLPVAADELHERLEVEFEGDEAVVPTPVLTLLRGLLVDRQLHPVARVVTTRHLRELRDPATGSHVEVADDMVRSESHGERGPSFRQVEIETTADAGEQTTQQLVKAFRHAGARTSRNESKLQQVLGSRSVGARPKLRRSSTATDLVRESITDGLHRLLANDPTIRASDSVEAIHQARVATRRLRSDLKSLEAVLDTDHTGPLRSELAWLAGLLGAVRDADVISESLREASAALGSTPDGVAGLLHRLAEQRDLAHLTLVDAMTSSRYLTLIDHLRRVSEHPPIRAASEARRALPTVQAATDLAYRRVDKFARRMPKHPPDEERHELRKRAKRARYAAELASPLVGKQAARFADRLELLQSALGEHQDLVVARQWLESLDLSDATGTEAFAAGKLHQHFTSTIKRPDPWRRAWRRAHHERLR
jgi:CHAD domain-containing protein